MRLRVSNEMPGVESERVETAPGELHREDVWDGGEYIGAVVYVRRPVATGTEYGWRVSTSTRWGLGTKREAIERLRGY